MGKITSQPPTATHFSHPHPLKLCNYDPTQTLSSSSFCAGCRLEPSGFIFSCTVCTYFLHKKCFEMPNRIRHPSHKDHTFTLLAQPAYADGSFKCDACWESGEGFSYHCKPCGVDLHILCAAMPLSVTNTACHVHKLDLAFGSPYHDKEFLCDVCQTRGSDHWLYRCSLCGFDAHLNCARGGHVHRSSQQSQNFMGFQSQGPIPQPAAAIPAPHPIPSFGQSFMAPRPPIPSFGQQFMAPRPPNLAAQPSVMNGSAFGVPAGVPAGNPVTANPFQVYGQQNELFLQTIQQIINNQNAMTQAVISGGGSGFGAVINNQGGNGGVLPAGFGGGGGVGSGYENQYLQQLIQSYSNCGNPGAGGINPADLSTFGVGSFEQYYLSQLSQMNGSAGGGMTGLNNFDCSAAGNQEYLQALMNSAGGGGGGGTEFLQSLLGGGGGLDFITGALGGFSL